jgi:predicted acylesterase/phospholipase RssA
MERAEPEPETETALVLAGAFAKGAFTAGALEVIAPLPLHVSRIVATSAGALNGVVFAAGLHAGHGVEAAAQLSQLWSELRWHDVLDLSLREILRGRGLATDRKLRGLLRDATERWHPGARVPIELCLIVAALGGDPETRRREQTTSFESVLHFRGASFDRAARREQIYAAATAAAAFPILYAPVEVPSLGPCIDGGTVNNTPVRTALSGRPAIRRIIVVASLPRLQGTPPRGGFALAEHIAEIIIHERLFRDLRDLRASDPDIEIVEIRPELDLPGSLPAGFLRRSLRRGYVEAGRRAARAALEPGLAAGTIRSRGGSRGRDRDTSRARRSSSHAPWCSTSCRPRSHPCPSACRQSPCRRSRWSGAARS